MEAFLATVYSVYLNPDAKPDLNEKDIPEYNGNKTYEKSNDIRLLGAIKFRAEKFVSADDDKFIAFPFDKNNLTYPIVGETIFIIDINNHYYWMPFSNSFYPNYREDKLISEITKEKQIQTSDTSASSADYGETKDTGTTGSSPNQSQSDKNLYKKNEKIKFLKPLEGDTIISGRVGNTIRFSEFFLTEDGKTSSPGIYIRNKQNAALDSKPVGELIDEDINQDGTSIYITSNKTKVPFKETIKKSKIAFTNFPKSTDLKGNQLFVNSDRITLSAKASEFIIFGKKNTGIITDGRFTIDAEKEIFGHSNSDIIFQTNKNIILNSNGNGTVYIGKIGTPGGVGAPVQRMVLAGELIDILSQLLDELTKMVFATPVGPTAAGSHNIMVFKSIKSQLAKIQSTTNFVSK
jgi:hypothetical protein